MVSMNTLPNNSGYYQLSNPSGGSNGGGNASSTNATEALLQALDTSSSASGSPSNNTDGYLLDLSPQAQQYMMGSGSATAARGTSGTNGSFVLTTQQQQSISNILAKYKDAPYTQATFNSIQNDLTAAELGASQLSQKDQAQNFNPTLMLIDDLNGNYSAATAMTTPDETGKASNYMQQVISQWQTISGHTTQALGSKASGGIAPVGSTGGA